MSTNYYVYAGPVLICKYHIAEKVTKKTIKFNGCSNSACRGNRPKYALGKSKFCPQCGQAVVPLEVEQVSKTKEKSVNNIYNMMIEGEFREDSFDACREVLIDGHDVLIPTAAKMRGSIEANDEILYVRSPDTVEEIEKCESLYAKEIAYLRTKYDEIKVEWVVLTTYS